MGICPIYPNLYLFYTYLDWKMGYFGLLLPFKVHQGMEFGLTQMTVDLTPTSPVLSIGYVRNNEHLGSAKNPSSDTATQVARKIQSKHYSKDHTSDKLVSNWAYNPGWWFQTFFIFHNIWECHHPNWPTHIFQRGRLKHRPDIFMSTLDE